MNNHDELVWHTHAYTIPAALSLLPGKMTSVEARAMMLAVALQESGFGSRSQIPNGQARGFWQFEKMGVSGILTHPSTHPIIAPICDLMLYPATTIECYKAIADNTELAAVFARLLLWIDVRTLPTAAEQEKGWQIYLTQWRPGKPRPKEWSANFRHAWQIVSGTL